MRSLRGEEQRATEHEDRLHVADVQHQSGRKAEEEQNYERAAQVVSSS
jgi:hypothetical protein